MTFFPAYVKISENRYREQFGISFEDFKVGQKFKHRPGITISQQDNKEESLETMNNVQLHYDIHYAEQTEWKQCLGVSTLTLQKVIGMTWKTFGKKQRIICFDDIAMTHPVFGGDTLYAESEIIAKEAYPDDPKTGLLSVITRGVNQRNEVVSEIHYKMLIYKKGNHPLEKDLPKEAYDLKDDKFASHRLLEDGTYMEAVGIYYENLEIGEIYEHRPSKTFTAEESRLHALKSFEWNFSEKYTHGKIPINETYLIGTTTALTTRTFGRVAANLEWKNIKLYEPVYAEDTIFCESKIISKRESKSRPKQGIMETRTQAYNQNRQLVCTYERHFLIYKKGLGPYEGAGY